MEKKEFEITIENENGITVEEFKKFLDNLPLEAKNAEIGLYTPYNGCGDNAYFVTSATYYSSFNEVIVA